MLTVDQKVPHVFVCRTERLGQNGISEILEHPFFVNDQWTWATIRQSTAAVTAASRVL